jgi:hypothetical protein
MEDNEKLHPGFALSAALIIAAVFVACAGVLDNYFLDDDFFQIWPYFLRTPSLGEYFRASPAGIFLRPVSFGSWAYNYTLFGANPLPYHVIVLVLHAASAVLLCALARRLSRNGYLGLVCGLLFAVFPLSTEVVSRAINRDDPLCLAFVLVSLLLYSKKAGRPATRAASLCSFVLALLTKEMAVIVPLLAAAYDVLFAADRLKDRRQTALRWLPYFSIAAIYAVVRFADPAKGTSGYLVHGMPPYYRLLEEHGAWGFAASAVKALFVPYRFLLAPFNRFVFGTHIGAAQLLFALVFCAPAALALASGFRRPLNRVMLFGFLLVFLGALPVCFLLDTVDYSGGLTNARYLYFSTAGFCLILAGCVYSLGGGRAGLYARRGLVACMLAAGALSLCANNSAFTSASRVSRALPLQVTRLHPMSPDARRPVYVLPAGDELYRHKGVHLFVNGGFPLALSFAYGFPVESYVVDRKWYLTRKADYGIGSERDDGEILGFDPGESCGRGYCVKWEPAAAIVSDWRQ